MLLFMVEDNKVKSRHIWSGESVNYLFFNSSNFIFGFYLFLLISIVLKLEFSISPRYALFIIFNNNSNFKSCFCNQFGFQGNVNKILKQCNSFLLHFLYFSCNSSSFYILFLFAFQYLIVQHLNLIHFVAILQKLFNSSTS